MFSEDPEPASQGFALESFGAAPAAAAAVETLPVAQNEFQSVRFSVSETSAAPSSLSSSSPQGLAFTISVSEPEKHETGVKAFVTYKVTSKTSLPGFPSEEVYVRRRFNDFLWLRSQLLEQHPELLVPALPERLPTKFMQRFSDAFLEKRRRALELFLTRVASHPQLSSAPEFTTFLQAKDWALKTAQETEDGGGITGLLKKISLKSWASVTENDPDAEKMINLKNYFENFQKQLQTIHDLFMKANTLGKDHTGALSELGPAFLLLAQLENELCEGLTRTGGVLTDDIAKLLTDQSEYEEYNVAETLIEYVLLSHAATEVLRNRNKKAQLYHESVVQLAALKDDLEKAKEAAAAPEETKSTFARWKDSISQPVSRVKALEEKIPEVEKLLATRQADLKTTTTILIEEMEKFHIWKLKDFKAMLLEYIHLQIDYHKKAQAAWESVIPVVEGISKPSKRSTWWVGRDKTE